MWIYGSVFISNQKRSLPSTRLFQSLSTKWVLMSELLLNPEVLHHITFI